MGATLVVGDLFPCWHRFFTRPDTPFRRPRPGRAQTSLMRVRVSDASISQKQPRIVLLGMLDAQQIGGNAANFGLPRMNSGVMAEAAARQE
ncbi:hypothetical protein EDC26_101120 [Paralcaligenes ureilyticus]|uniref:Uncharacterized protein n=1 Tax=Paralcaligenes ureilyticus TaxID=627131 RepID=A0A4R3MBI6_9BURK|nr:hypothetical protein EDC26_101120 [Paralcaligenes ureilyticus]